MAEIDHIDNEPWNNELTSRHYTVSEGVHWAGLLARLLLGNIDRTSGEKSNAQELITQRVLN